MNNINIKLSFKFILLLNFLLLFGCGGVKEKIGLIKKAPDEFQVYEQKPLSVPPNFELRPPLDSDIVLEDASNNNIIFREEVNIDDSLTIGDEVLLISIGDKDTEKDIRKVINSENSISEVKKPLLDKILDFEPIFDVDKKDNNIIDAEEEKKRIEEMDNKNFEQTISDSIDALDDKKEQVNNSNKVVGEEKSFLDEIFDFNLFSSEDEELEYNNQRDKTFFNKQKNKSVIIDNEIELNDEIDKSNEQSQIIDAVISEKEGSID